MSDDTIQHAAFQDVPELVPLDFPLQGAQLIEASAGTGKTWTIAALYVRLVLGHGASVAAGAGLVPPNILVVTFTEAATQELRDRIRSRLSEAARYFRHGALHALGAAQGSEPWMGAVTVAADAFLDELRASYAPAEWALCARKLELAAEWMDEAAVSTIHSWCYKMLRQHAFDTGSLFTQELEKDETPLLSEAVRDYWRIQFSGLPASVQRPLCETWSSPEVLQGAIRAIIAEVSLIEQSDDNTPPDFKAYEGFVTDHNRFMEEKQTEYIALKRELRENQSEWVDTLRSAVDEFWEADKINKNSFNKKTYPGWFESLEAWLASENLIKPQFATETAWKNLSAEGVRSAWKKSAGPLPNLAPFEVFSRLSRIHNAEAEKDQTAKQKKAALCKMTLGHAVCWTARRFDDELRKRARLGFNELLTRLDEALDTHADWMDKRASARRLIERIRQDFPVALIDEFQDTDPVQYRIFRSLYLDHAAQSHQSPDTPLGTAASAESGSTALILIGDPKQAIYAFRGADIYTYLQARRACENNLHTLKKNFRSTEPVVEAVNALFMRAENTEVGAFRFKNGASNPVPFVPATAKDRPERLIVITRAGVESVPALTLHHISNETGKLRKDSFMRWSAARCAERMVELLNAGAAIPPAAGFSEDGTTIATALRPADMAVLVNNFREANIIRSALKTRGVRSVYLSEKDGVFATDEARQIYFLLEACATPENIRTLRTALAIPLLGRSLAELEQLGQDESALEARQEEFRAYREVWRKQGVLPMLRRVLHHFGVPARLLGVGGDLDGERILTNTLHLAELLQQASDLLEGEQALIRFLAEQIYEDSGDDPGERKLRLESDEQLVKVVTVHKSKGLEYPLVFLPFACNTHFIDGKHKKPFKYHDQDHTLCIALNYDDKELLASADQERLAEDLRKLYVALTRARHATWVGLGETSELRTKINKNAIRHLLWGTGVAETSEIPAFAEVPDNTIHLCEPLSDEQAASLSACTPFNPPPTALGESRPVCRSAMVDLRETWWVASYSAIAKHAAPGAAEDPAAAERLGLDRGAVAATFDVIAPTSPEEAQFDEDHRIAEQESAPPAGAAFGESGEAIATHQTPHLFPGGTGVGTFLHGLFEAMAQEGFDTVAADPLFIETLVKTASAGKKWDDFIPGLTEWIRALVTTPLPLGDPSSATVPRVALGQLARTQVKPEMEFWLSASGVNLLTLDNLVRSATLDGAPRPGLQNGLVNGMLKGFIDLLFEHEGRYYVLDYKSNRIGPAASDYTPEAMRRMILHSRYDLQYVLYLFALHRLLQSRLAGYDYDTHVGGAVYLFLRGIHGPARGVHFERPPKALIERLDTLFSAHDTGAAA